MDAVSGDVTGQPPKTTIGNNAMVRLWSRIVGQGMGAKRSLSGVSGWVYFIRCRTTGLVKIGWSGMPPRGRFNALVVILPTPLELVGAVRGSLGTEASLHIRFKADRDHGEWFRPSEGLDRYIAEEVRPPDEADFTHEELRRAVDEIEAGRAEKYARGLPA